MTYHRLGVFLGSLALLVVLSGQLWSQVETVEQPPKQEEDKKGYEFTVEVNHESTDVKSQGSTGTCWSFATSSFMESELIRQGKGQHNLSEMFIVKNIYRDKARNYLLRQGKANFGEGGLSHDFINAATRHGLVPEEAFSGLLEDAERHDHSEMSAVLKGILDGLVGRRRLSPKWLESYERVLDVYLGESPSEFTYGDTTYTPQSFAEFIGFSGKDYVSVSSYNHHPFYEPFVLEIPDNYSNGSYENVPIDQLVDIIDYAINNGFTVAWDGDVSEKGFSSSKGIAILPKDATRGDMFKTPGEEVQVDQAMRQQTLEDYSTTDDHLMHLTGIAKDQNGAKYYIIKNSWGEVGPYDGFVYMSEAYVRLKTVAIMVHKDAIPGGLRGNTQAANDGSTTQRN